jgi:hypothetical protein
MAVNEPFYKYAQAGSEPMMVWLFSFILYFFNTELLQLPRIESYLGIHKPSKDHL